jgi:microcystin-dependent protein
MTTFGTGTAITAQSLNTAFANLQAQIASASGAPLGAVMMWAGTTANIPSGYAVCNGAPLATTGTYASLFAILQYRYGGSGATFNLPDFLSRVPQGITTVAPVGGTSGTTFATSVSSAVDFHTHTVNSSLIAGNTNTSLTAGSVNSSFTAGNTADHNHGHSLGTAAGDHQHTYFKPNSGGNNVTFGNGNAGAAHSHGINGTVNASDRTLTVNSSFTAGNTNTSLTAGSVNTSLTAGNASTINTSTTAHTHTTAVTQIIFIIKVI